MSNCNQLVNAGVSWFQTGLVRGNKIVVEKIFEHSVRNGSFNVLLNNGRRETGLQFCHTQMNHFLMHWHYHCFFYSAGKIPWFRQDVKVVWFVNRVVTYLTHANINHIMIVSLVRIQFFCYTFDVILLMVFFCQLQV